MNISYHNHYINWGNTLFAHNVPFINMTYTLLFFKYWKSYVHMMCLIPMLNPSHSKPNWKSLDLLLLPSPNSVWKVGWDYCIDGLHCPMFAPCKIAFNSRLFISSTMAIVCGDTLVGNVNATSSFKHWKSLVSLIKRSHITSSKGSCRLHVCPTSSPMGLYQIPSRWGPNSNLLVDLWVKPPLKYLVKPFAFYIVGVGYKTSHDFWIWDLFKCHLSHQVPNVINDMPTCQIHCMYALHASSWLSVLLIIFPMF